MLENTCVMNRTTWYENHNHSKPITIVNGMLKSEKGFVIHPDKLSGYCLKPGMRHAQEFMELGYGSEDAYMLFRDIELSYDAKKAVDTIKLGQGITRFSIPMILGVNRGRYFRTVWQLDCGQKALPRFITAYVDRRMCDEESE